MSPTRLHIILLSVFISLGSFGNSNNVNELKQSLSVANTKEDSFYVSSELVKIYSTNNPDSAFYYLEICNTIAVNVGDPKMVGDFHHLKAVFNKTLGKYNQALDQALKAITYYNTVNDKAGIIASNTLIGHIYALRGEYEKSLLYYNESINSTNQPLEKLNALIGKGNVQYYMDSLNAAEATFNDALKIVEKFKPSDKILKAGLYANTGNLYLSKKDYLKAINLYKKGFDLYFSLNDKLGMSLLAFNIGDAFLGINEYDSSEKYFNINLFLGQELHNAEEIKYAYKGFTNLYEQKGDFESALDNYYKYVHISDSLRDSQYSKEVDVLTDKYQKSENISQKKEDTIQEKQNLIVILLITSTILFFIGGLVVIILYRKSLKVNKLLQISSDEIIEKNRKIDKALHQKEILLKEVHHRVKNNLQIIASLLNLQQIKTKNKEASEAIQESKTRVQTIALMHKSLYRNDDFEAVDLKNYISELAVNHKSMSFSSEIDVDFKLDIDNTKLKIDSAVPIGLILSELISNSLKHAFDSTKENPTIFIHVAKTNKGIVIEYGDNGKGVDVDIIEQTFDSVGYEVIFALIEQVDGTLDILTKKPLHLSILLSNEV